MWALVASLGRRDILGGSISLSLFGGEFAARDSFCGYGVSGNSAIAVTATGVLESIVRVLLGSSVWDSSCSTEGRVRDFACARSDYTDPESLALLYNSSVARI
jgi:hypothetical protein